LMEDICSKGDTRNKKLARSDREIRLVREDG
jgi:hypothetical protein